MPAPKGNKYAQGNKGGRPRKVAKDNIAEYGRMLVAEFEEHLRTLETHKDPIFIEAWARKHDITDETLRKYRDESQEFSVSYKRAREIQKEVLIRGAMKGWFNPTAFIFTAKNITDMRDKQEIDHTTKGEKIVDAATDLDALADEVAQKLKSKKLQ